jgi:hypothetical protein
MITCGFTNENAFWWDSHPWREDHPFDPAKQYSPVVLRSHNQWYATLRANMHAKVEIVFGKPAQLATKALYRAVWEELVLWDQHNTTVHLQFTGVSKKFLARILIIFPHPHAIYYNYSLETAVMLDSKLKVASPLAKVLRTESKRHIMVGEAMIGKGVMK